MFSLKFGFLAKNSVGLCPPDLKRPTGGDFPSRQVNFDESWADPRSVWGVLLESARFFWIRVKS